MDNNENLVLDQNAENTEQTAEQTPKTYTEEEFNAKLDEVLGKKIARKEAKIRKEYERKYGDLEDVLRAGTGKDNVVDMTDTFRNFYQSKGINIPQRPAHSEKDEAILARADADEIIHSGDDEVADELKRLTDIGFENMTAREKAVFKTLAEHRNDTERGRQLSQIGVTADVYNSQEFKDFSSKFGTNVPITEVFDIYSKMQPKKEIKTMGSMKNSDSNDSGVKDFYTPEEARKFTKKDYDENPALFKAVCGSMSKWKK